MKFFLASLKSSKKGVGSGSELDPDPDPLVRGTDPQIRIRNQNVTDPQHCLLE
jgi:hypothetical protein